MPGKPALLCPAKFYCPAGAMAPVKCPAGRTSEAGSSLCNVAVEQKSDDYVGLIPVGVICAIVLFTVFFMLYYPRARTVARGIRLRIVR